MSFREFLHSWHDNHRALRMPGRARFSHNWLLPSLSSSRWRHMTPPRRPEEKRHRGRQHRWEGSERKERNCVHGREEEVHGASVENASSSSRAVLEPRHFAVSSAGEIVKDATKRCTTRWTTQERRGNSYLSLSLSLVAFVLDRHNFRRRTDASTDETRILDRMPCGIQELAIVWAKLCDVCRVTLFIAVAISDW